MSRSKNHEDTRWPGKRYWERERDRRDRRAAKAALKEQREPPRIPPADWNLWS